MFVRRESGAAWPQTLSSAGCQPDGVLLAAKRHRTRFDSLGNKKTRREMGEALGKSAGTDCTGQRAASPCYPGRWLTLFLGFACCGIARAQDALTPPETSEIVVSATRLPIPEADAPASVTILTDEDFEIHQDQRAADALREVPGLSVVQTGAAGQLTSVFTRGLRSEHTQVLIDGVPINQGLQGAFNFADLTLDNIARIEIVRGPQSTIYGPRALAGVIQLFTKAGGETPETSFSAEGGSYRSYRAEIETSGRIGQFDYSLGGSRFETENARPNNQYRLWNFLGNLGWSPDESAQSVFTEWVKVRYLTPSSAYMRRTARLLLIMWPPSMPINAAIFPCLWALRT